jgi:hypothetical protein
MGQVVRLKEMTSSALALIQREFPQYHPLIGLARLAHKKEVTDDPRLEFDVHKALLPYVTPRLASLEVKDSRDDDRRVVVSLFEETTLENGRTVETEVPLVTLVEDAVELDPD